MNQIRRQITLFAVGLLAASLCGACASPKKQRESSAEPTETTRSESSTGESTSEPERLQVRKRVHFENILGERMRRDRPPGCTGTWDPLKNSPYRGRAFFCSEFNGPEKWGEIPVTMVVQEGVLSVISVQVFFDGSEGAKEEWEDFTGNLIGRCDRKTGFERYEIYACKDYVVDVRWVPGHESAQLQVVYARSMKSLKRKAAQ